MATGITAVISPQAHRRIDQLTFPGLLATAAWMARWDRRAAAVTLLGGDVGRGPVDPIPVRRGDEDRRLHPHRH